LVNLTHLRNVSVVVSSTLISKLQFVKSITFTVQCIHKVRLSDSNRYEKTEISSSNQFSGVYASGCKELMKIASELRHLGGVKGNFVISETEYLSATTTAVLKESQPALQVIYSSAKGIEAQQYTFNTFWSRALSAEYRIREIEEGVKYAGTKIIDSREDVFNHMRYVIDTATERSVCVFGQPTAAT
jgi:hypothetical protein